MAKIEVLEKKDHSLKLRLDGEDHTLASLLTGYLRRIEGVVRAFYEIPHPLTGSPEVYIMTNGNITPEEALRTALENMQKDLQEFRSNYLKSIEEGGSGN